MSDLKESVRNAIANYVSSKLESHTEADVLRVIRDQATLLFERQTIVDVLDSDPMEQLAGAKSQVDKVKAMLEVISCNRTVTHDGFSSIEATIQWKQQNGKMMDETVKEHLQFNFKYERRPMRPEDVVSGQVNFGGPELHPVGNHISYTIHLSKDHGEREQLMTVEVWAPGDGPSQEKAEPLVADGDDWEDMDEREEMDEEGGKSDDDDMDAQPDETKEDEMDSPPLQQGELAKRAASSKSDKFAAYIDPDALENLTEWSSLELSVPEYFFLLMTFPFYEQEWDLVGFVLDTVFSDDDGDDDGGGDSGDEDKEDYDDASLDAVEFDKDGEEVGASDSD
jgi:hypothetical protein